MISGLKCESCKLQDICMAYKKLRPFDVDARVDLGVTLDFLECVNYIREEDPEEENEAEEELAEVEDDVEENPAN